MLPEEKSCSFLHFLFVKRVVIPPCAPMPYAGALRSIDQEISIAAPVRGESRVKIFFNRRRPAHRHRWRKKGIDSPDPGRQRANCRCLEVNDLPRCMNTGIRAPCTHNRHWMPGNMGQCSFQFVLNGPLPGLGLPTTKCSAVVLDPQRESHEYPPIRATAIAAQRHVIISPSRQPRACCSISTVSQVQTSGIDRRIFQSRGRGSVST